jgi:alanine dehydrogenase
LSAAHAARIAERELLPMRFLTDEQVSALLDWDSLIPAMRCAYGERYDEAMDPGRLVVRGTGSVMRALPAASPSGDYMGVKLFAASNSTPRVRQLVIGLFNQHRGTLEALMDARAITKFRTAAVSAVAVDSMTRPQEISLAVLGSGHEAYSHVAAVARVRTIKRLAVFSPTPANREKFAFDFAADLGVRCIAARSAREAVEGADLILAAARSRDETPIIVADWCKDNATVISIGSTLPEQREIGPDLLSRTTTMVCDVVHEVLNETGDLIAARGVGIDMTSRTVSLHGWLTNCALGKPLPEQGILLFKSVGSGFQDVVAAEVVLVRAIAAGVGQALELNLGVSIRG